MTYAPFPRSRFSRRQHPKGFDATIRARRAISSARLAIPAFTFAATRVFPGQIVGGNGLIKNPAGRGAFMTVRDQAFYEAQAEDELRLAVSLKRSKFHANQAAEFAATAKRLLNFQVSI